MTYWQDPTGKCAQTVLSEKMSWWQRDGVTWKADWHLACMECHSNSSIRQKPDKPCSLLGETGRFLVSLGYDWQVELTYRRKWRTNGLLKNSLSIPNERCEILDHYTILFCLLFLSKGKESVTCKYNRSGVKFVIWIWPDLVCSVVLIPSYAMRNRGYSKPETVHAS